MISFGMLASISLMSSRFSGDSTPVVRNFAGGITITDTESDDVKYLGTARARLGGVPFANWDVLLYGTAGLAWGGVNRIESKTVPLPPPTQIAPTPPAPRPHSPRNPNCPHHVTARSFRLGCRRRSGIPPWRHQLDRAYRIPALRLRHGRIDDGCQYYAGYPRRHLCRQRRAANDRCRARRALVQILAPQGH